MRASFSSPRFGCRTTRLVARATALHGLRDNNDRFSRNEPAVAEGAAQEHQRVETCDKCANLVHSLSRLFSVRLWDFYVGVCALTRVALG